MTEQQSDTAREAVSQWLADYTGWWQPKGPDDKASDTFGADADKLLAALAEHVVPRADEWEWGVAVGGTVSVANRYSEAWCRDYVATARANGHPDPRVVRRSVVRGQWEAVDA